MQANIKHIEQLGLKSVTKEIVEGLQDLWYAPTKEKFDMILVAFFDTWDKREPTYTSYFQNNWVQHHLPERWALYGRPSDAPAGIIVVKSYSLVNTF
jgi:hypothetical protein